MELIPLNCNNCGAKLKVGEDTKFVTCKQCDAQLAVRHEDGAAFTDVLEAAARVEKSAAAIEEHVEKLGADNEKLFVQGEIDRLDREWETRREGFLIRRKNGHTHVPTRTSPALIGVVAMLAFAPAMLISVVDESGELGLIVWLGALVFAGIIVLAFLNVNAQAGRYQQALADHEAEREQLLEKLRAL
jgi:hypothetical protein